MILFIPGDLSTNSLLIPLIRYTLGLDVKYTDKQILSAFTLAFPGHGQVDEHFEIEKIEKSILEFISEKKSHQEDFTRKMLLSHSNEIISMIKDRRLFLIGHSFGGQVALRFAAKYPEKVKSLVLLGAGNRFSWIGMTFITVWIWILSRLKASTLRKLVKALPNFLLSWKTIITLVLEYPNLQGVKSTLKAMRKHNFQNFFNKLSLHDQRKFSLLPILILNGRFDLVNNVFSAKKLVQILEQNQHKHLKESTLIGDGHKIEPASILIKIYKYKGHNLVIRNVKPVAKDIKKYLLTGTIDN